MPDDPATPTTVLVEPDKVAPLTPVSRGGQATSQAATNAPLGKVASTVVITDGTSGQAKLKGVVTKYAKAYLPAGAEIRAVKDWPDFYQALGEYDTIDTLVVFLHGDPGMIGIGDHAKGLGVVVSEIQDAGAKVTRVTTKLTFESCNVGSGPVRTAEFAKLLQAPVVSAWTHFHALQTLEVTVTSTTTAADIDTWLADYQGYLVPETPSSADLAKRPGKHVIFVEWFQDAPDQTPLPPKPPVTEIDDRSKTFRPRSQATVRNVTSNEAKALQEEYDTSIQQPELVTITIVP